MKSKKQTHCLKQVKNFTSPFPFKISLSSAITWLTVIYFSGILGLLIPTSRPWFELATPLSLLISVLFLLYFHQDWNIYFTGFMAFAFIAGFGIEVIGVKTGMIFGSYTYKTTLGYKVLEVPLLIGINWLMLTYATGVLFAPLKVSPLIKSIMAALLMTGIDYTIEPIAILHNYWDWHNALIPVQNYLAWFFISLMLAFIFYLLPFSKENPLAKYLIIIQVSFFILLQLGHRFID